MATEAQVQAHAGEMEYLKEQARMAAETITADVDFRDLLDDPTGWTEAVLESIRDAVSSLLDDAATEARDYIDALGLMYDEGDLEDAADEARSDFASWAMPILSGALAPALQTLQDQAASGLSEDTIVATLEADGTRDALLARFDSASKMVAAALIQDAETRMIQGAAQTTEDNATADGQAAPTFAWITLEDKNVCEDAFENSCAPRHGEERTMAEWEELGPPGSPNLLCEMYGHSCRCALDASGEVPDNVVNISDAIAAGRARARGQDAG